MNRSLKKYLVIVALLLIAACREKPLSFPLIQKYQVTPGDLFYFRSDGQFVVLERRKAADIAISPADWQAFANPTNITISRPVAPKPGEFHGSRTAESTLENTPFVDTPTALEHLVFSPDGKFLAGGAADGSFAAWDVATSQPLQLRQPAGILSVAFSPSGALVAVGIGTHSVVEAAGTVRLFEYPTGLLKANFGSSPGTTVAFTPDGALVAGFADGSWQQRSAAGEMSPAVTVAGAPITALTVHPSGRAIATAHTDKLIRLWDSASHQLIGTLASDVPANPLFPRGIERIAFNAPGTQLGAAYADGEMRIWNTAALTPPPPK